MNKDTNVRQSPATKNLIREFRPCLRLPHNTNSFIPLIRSFKQCAAIRTPNTNQPSQSRSLSLMHSREFLGHFHLYIGVNRERNQKSTVNTGYRYLQQKITPSQYKYLRINEVANIIRKIFHCSVDKDDQSYNLYSYDSSGKQPA